jgi:hypothetical protein
VVTSNLSGNHELLADSLEASLLAMESDGQWKAGIIATNMDDATVDPVTDWLGAYPHCCIVHGRARMKIPNSSIARGYATTGGCVPVSVRAAGSLISTDLKRVPGNGKNDGGPLPNVAHIFVDEANSPTGLDDIKISTLRTFRRRAGYYITHARIKSAAGSDLTIWPRRLVLNMACETVQDVQTTFLGRSVRVKVDGSGQIDERDARRLEDEVRARLAAVLTAPRNADGGDGHVSAFDYQIDRTNNVLTTGIVKATLGIVPLGSIDRVEADVSFVSGLSPVIEGV